MKKLTLLFCAALAGIFLPACSDENNGKVDGIIDVPTTDNIELSRSEQDVNEGINRFAFDLLNAIARDYETAAVDKDGNFAVSPVSATMALALMANTADGDAAQKVSDVLGYKDLATLNSTCNKLLRYLPNGKGGSRAALANSVWHRESMTPTAECAKTLNDVLFAEVNAVNASDMPTVNEMIDSWCYAKTNGAIPRISDAFGGFESILFLNAMYYRSEWSKKFEDKDTKYKDFHGTNRTSIVKMMSTVREGVYYELEHAGAIAIPFKGNYEMVFILPGTEISADELSKTLTAAEWDKKTAHAGDIKLEVPKFNVESTYDLTDVLQSMGIPMIPALPGLGCNGMTQLNCVQRTSASIDEEGAVVAAATAVYGYTSPSNITRGELVLDRPFLYLLRNTVTGSVLLAGRINNLPDAE